MDGYSRKKAVNGLAAPRKGAGFILRETSNSREHNAQICSRVGCSSRHNSTKGTQIVSDKATFSRPSYRTLSSSKGIVGSSSKACAVVSGARKSSLNPPKKLSSHLETDTSERGAGLNEPEATEVVSSSGKVQRELNTESQGASSIETAVGELGSSSTMSNTRSRRNIHQRSGLSNRDCSSQYLASRTTSQPVRANGSRYGFKNLKCNSISDVVASGCSSSDSSKNMRKDAIEKRNSDGESISSTGGKKMAVSSLESRSSSYSHNASVSESRRARNWPQIRDSAVASVRTRRPASSYGRTRLTNPGNIDTNSLSSQERTAVNPQVPQSEESIDFNALSSAVAELSHANSFNRPATRSEDLLDSVPSSPSEVSISRSLMNRDGFRRYDMEGIAEVLLALERFEQDEELSYEQLLVLETSLFLNGLNLYDQHRDMRLDIDNMSYEELLALEERMGSVSTALSEEALSKCLSKSIYNATPEENSAVDCILNKEDNKCSVCQEEYVVGDELGSLQCEHTYHFACAEQWLCVKNWCPICKTEASSSPGNELK